MLITLFVLLEFIKSILAWSSKFHHISHNLSFYSIDKFLTYCWRFSKLLLPISLFIGHFACWFLSLRHSSLHFLHLFSHQLDLSLVHLGFYITEPTHLLDLKQSIFKLLPLFFLLFISGLAFIQGWLKLINFLFIVLSLKIVLRPLFIKYLLVIFDLKFLNSIFLFQNSLLGFW